MSDPTASTPERMVQHLVNRYRWAAARSAGLDVEDLEQVGRAAVLKADRTWDPERGACRTSWMFRIVRHAIHREANDRCDTVRTPLTALARSERRPGFVWQDDAVAAAPDDPEQALDAKRERERVRAALDALPPRLARILRLQFFEDVAPGDIAAEFGLTSARIRQLRQLALRQLAEHLQPESSE